MANENTRQSFVVKHINSNQLVNDAPKLPTAEQIEYGEIAINYAKGHETISIKNNQNEIVPLYISEVGKVGKDYQKTTYPEPFNTKVSESKIAANDLYDTAFKKVEGVLSTLVEEVLIDENVTAEGVAALGKAAGIINENGKIAYIKKENPKFIGAADNVSEAVDMLDEKVNDIITFVIKNKIQAAFDTFVAANPGLNNITVV